MKVFRDALHGLYLDARTPTMAAIAQVVRDNDDLPGSPSSDTIDRILRAATFPRNVQNVEAVAWALAHLAGGDAPAQQARLRQLWEAAE
ncbi:hypothetical protein ACFQ1S_18965, partial [Kibdelosporangium lantanae]